MSTSTNLNSAPNPNSECHTTKQQQAAVYSIDNATILLPFFVTVEGYRVAAYSLGGEPRLCLPQLIQFLRQKFTVKKIVDKFEESNVKFATATPKQVQGFIRFKALLSEAKTCPLIKFSDANRVCLRLYESCHKKRNDGQFFKGFESLSNSFASQNKSLEARSLAHSTGDQLKPLSQDENLDREFSSKPNYDNYFQNSRPSTSGYDQNNSARLFRDTSLLPRTNAIDPAAQSMIYTCKRLHPFDPSEIDTSLTIIPETLSATLRVQVYHRCIGKCSASYYPYLLKNGKAKCIQCKVCKIFFPPRRFVGHTHKSTEDNVCHWGFNSCNWRCYIRLSRKQTDNNLDDSELLNQFRTLQFAPDFVDEIDDTDYDLDCSDSQTSDSSKSDQDVNKKNLSQSGNVPPNRYNDWRKRANSLVLPPNPSITKPMVNQSLSGDCDLRHPTNPLIGCRVKSPYGYVAPVFRDGCMRLPKYNEFDTKIPPYVTKFDPIHNNVPNDTLNLLGSHEPLAYKEDFTKMMRLDYPSLDPLNMNPIKLPRDGFAFSGQPNIPTLGRDILPTSLCSTPEDREFRREMYVCFKLAGFLTRRGIEQPIVNEVVESTLNLMRESRRFLV